MKTVAHWFHVFSETDTLFIVHIYVDTMHNKCVSIINKSAQLSTVLTQQELFYLTLQHHIPTCNSFLSCMRFLEWTRSIDH